MRLNTLSASVIDFRLRITKRLHEHPFVSSLRLSDRRPDLGLDSRFPDQSDAPSEGVTCQIGPGEFIGFDATCDCLITAR